jgi:hypothetical protein
MSGDGRPVAAARRETKNLAALVAAYRDGSGLTAIVLAGSHDGNRIEAVAANKTGEAVPPRYWCRRAGDADRVAAAAAAQLRRRQARGGEPAAALAAAVTRQIAGEAVVAAARRLAVAIYSDEEIDCEAAGIIARMEQEWARLQGAGGLKDVNRAYRAARMQAASRGEKIAPYAQWINKYRENLLRQLAAALR